MGRSGLVMIGSHVNGGGLGYDSNMAVVWMEISHTCYTTIVGLNTYRVQLGLTMATVISRANTCPSQRKPG
jgi:hypothetical protein